MALNNQPLIFNLDKTFNLFNLNAKQYDTDNSRAFTFYLIQKNMPFNLNNITVTIGGKKPDDTDILNNVTVIDNDKGIIQVNLTTQMLVKDGILNLELILMKESTRLSSYPFQITIVKSTTDFNSIQSSDEFGALTNALTVTDKYATELKQGTENIELKYADNLNGLKPTVDRLKNTTEQFKSNFYTNRNLFGTFDNACGFGIIANSDDRPQILGIPVNNDSILAQYENRDNCGLYVSNTTNDSNRFEVNTATYTVNTIILPITFDTSKIKIGMIIDTLHTPKFSGIIKSINKNIIEVYNWYQIGNTDTGQIPTGSLGCIINNNTKLWGINLNVFLMEKDHVTPVSACETGVFNYQEQPREFVNGYDTISMGNKHCGSAYIARTLNNTLWKIGFKALNCEIGNSSDDANIGTKNSNSKNVGSLSADCNIGFQSTGNSELSAFIAQTSGESNFFELKNNGNFRGAGIITNIINTNSTISTSLSNFHFLKTNNPSLPNASTCPGKFLILHNVTSSTSTITGMVQSGSTIKTGFFLDSGKSAFIISDGNYWHILDFGFRLP